MNTVEGRERWANARQLLGDGAEEGKAAARAAVPLDPHAADVQLLERRQQLEGKGVLLPVLPDNGRNFGVGDPAYPLEDFLLLRAQRCSEIVEVAVRGR